MRTDESLPTTGIIGLAVASSTGPVSDETLSAALEGAEGIGFATHLVAPGEDQTALGFLLGIGYQPAFAAVFDGPRVCPRILWLGEPLPALGDARVGAPALSRALLFKAGQRALHVLPPGRLRRSLSGVGGSTASLEPWHNLDLAVALARRSDRFVVTSRDRAAILASVGVQADVVPFGYAERLHGPLAAGGDRDIQTLVLGSYWGARSHRRQRLVEAMRAQGLPVAVVEGNFGESRNRLLRRTRVVLHVHRIPGTFVGIRLVLALAAGAVVVSEPMLDPHPFVPGVHFVQAPLDRLSAETTALLADEPRRRRIVEAGQALLADELTMAHCLRRVLAIATPPA